jgi:hypothetical protein
MQTINLGTTANDGTGDDLRTAGQKINENFLSPHFGVYYYEGDGMQFYTGGTTALLQNNGANSVLSLAFPDVPTILDSNRIDLTSFTIGDNINISCRITVETTVVNQKVTLKLENLGLNSKENTFQFDTIGVRDLTFDFNYNILIGSTTNVFNEITIFSAEDLTITSPKLEITITKRTP